ncbi:hypothetical protein TNCV_3935581 [Trichonephila clavipes]|nr:hypothetical protein TNCV_3935581 [Trichonephila clavipes]
MIWGAIAFSILTAEYYARDNLQSNALQLIVELPGSNFSTDSSETQARISPPPHFHPSLEYPLEMITCLGSLGNGWLNNSRVGSN